MDKKYYCFAVGHGVSITATSKVDAILPCCQAGRRDETPELETERNTLYDIDSFDQILEEREQWAPNNEAHKSMCRWCLETYSTGPNAGKFINGLPPFPYRNLPTPKKEYGHRYRYHKNEIRYLGPLMLDNTCNLMCYICGTQNSSKWAATVPTLTGIEKFKESKGKESWYNPDHLAAGKLHSKQLKKVLMNSDLSGVRYLDIVGGEPMYTKMFLWLMTYLNSQVDLKKVDLAFNTNGSIFPTEVILNIFKKFNSVQVKLSLDAVGDLQEVTRPGVSWETTDSVIGKWVKFRDECNTIRPHSSTLDIETVISLLNVNKIPMMASYFHEKGIVKDIDNFDGWNSSIYKGKDIWSMDYVWGKPYLSSGLIPSQIRKKWLLNNPDFNLAKRVIDSYGDYLLPDNLDWVNDDKGRFMPKWLYRKRTIRKCLLYLAIIEKHATKKFSDVNPEVYQYLQEAAR